MAKRLDLYEVKAIINDIFADITGLITNYDIHIELNIDDAIMALFGKPSSKNLIRTGRYELLYRFTDWLDGSVFNVWGTSADH